MRVSLEERIRKRMRRIGKKNKFCRVCIIPVMAFAMFLLHGVYYGRDNRKRFAMLTMTILLFTVYSSFSFPIFISGDGSGSGLNPVSEEAENIVLAEETEIHLEDFELLDDEDVLLEGEGFAESSHGMDIVTKYSASEILDSVEGYEGPEKEEELQEELPEFSKDDWRLVLINKQHSIPDDYTFTHGAINTIKGSMECDERIIDELLAMLKSAKGDGVTLAICSPYRDFEYQQMLFNRKIKRYMGMGMSYMEAYQLSSQAVTVPGVSEHQIGLALDIVTNSYLTLDEGFGETDAGKWLAENSHKYGFILRYPKGKEYITGIEYEPWHFRYVGVEAATVITERGITLEEFWEEL